MSSFMNKKQVFTIVLNWNGFKDTIECIRSLEKITYPEHKIIIIDNASSDNSVNEFTNQFPTYPLLINTSNLGFAEGNNVGIRYALDNGADYVFLLNNDTTVAPDIIESLIALAQQYPNAGLLNPKIYFYDDPGRIWSAGGYWDNKAKCFEQFGEGELDKGQYDTVTPIEFAIGCAMFIPRAVIERVGLLDNTYFLNYEEIDYCFRIKHTELDVLYVPEAKVWHKISASFGGESSPLKLYYTFRNRLLWAQRHLTFFKILLIHASVYKIVFKQFFTPLNFSHPKKLLWSIASSFKNPIARASLKGVIDYWQNKFGECGKDIYLLQSHWKKTQSDYKK